MDVNDRIADLAAPGAQAAGLIIDEVKVSAAGKRSRVLITVDLPEDAEGSADLDAIAEASRAIGAALDEANVPAGAYVLEVSTPGTDRPLTERRHFARARTRKVSVTLKQGGPVEGRVLAVGDEGVTLEGATEGEKTTLDWDDIVRGTIVLEWNKE